MTPTPSSRNLVVCCDGTGNVWGNKEDTNVVRLARHCIKDDTQVVYYDPGVGTAERFPAVSWLDNAWFKLRMLAGLALGGGIYENIGEAYAFLVQHWRPGDRIFLFGFSRGAFTARAVSGMVSMFGIVRPAAQVMIPTLLRIYFSDREKRDARGFVRAELAADMRAHFSEAGFDARVHFIGVWDTVATVGGLRPRVITSDTGVANKRFDHVRHAVSEGESRWQYAPRLYSGTPQDTPGPGDTPSLKQVWFPGAHSDVGGSYCHAGLSDIALLWMLDEACEQGLRVKPHEDLQLPLTPFAPAHDQTLAGGWGPWWALTGLQRREPPPAGQQHPALAWRDAEPDRAPMAWRRPWDRAVWLPLLMVALLVVAQQIELAAGSSGVLQVATLQLTAPWIADPEGRHAALAMLGSRLTCALLLDVLLIGVYTHLLCTACVRSLRRLRDWRAHDAGTHTALRRAWLAGLWAAPLADLAENALTACLAASPAVGPGYPVIAGLLMLAGLTKWLALAGLGALALLGLACGRRPAHPVPCPP